MNRHRRNYINAHRPHRPTRHHRSDRWIEAENARPEPAERVRQVPLLPHPEDRVTMSGSRVL